MDIVVINSNIYYIYVCVLKETASSFKYAESLYNQHREFSPTTYLGSYITDILHYCGPFITVSNPAWVHC